MAELNARATMSNVLSATASLSQVVLGAEPATGNAVVADVLAGKTFSNAVDSGLTGTMPNIGAQNITPSASNQSISAGYHNGSGVVAGDADLTAGNIKKNVAIFGVTGTYEGDTSAIKSALDAANEEASADVDAAIALVDANYGEISAAIAAAGVSMSGVKPSGYHTAIASIVAASGDAVAADLLTGKTAATTAGPITGTRAPAMIQASGQTGTDAGGVDYPSPRFIDNGNGTITDKLTGLMWAKDLNLAATDYGRYASWTEAKSACEAKNIGGHTDWRLPNVKEVDSLIDWSAYPLTSYLTTAGFSNSIWQNFWLNTVAQNNTGYAFYITSVNGIRNVDLKTGQHGYVPVRGPVAL